MAKKPRYQTDHCICAECEYHECIGDFTFHHITTRKSGGPDSEWNMMPVCINLHNEIHNKGLAATAIKYWQVRQWLKHNNWTFDSFRNKWIHGE